MIGSHLERAIPTGITMHCQAFAREVDLFQAAELLGERTDWIGVTIPSLGHKGGVWVYLLLSWPRQRSAPISRDNG